MKLMFGLLAAGRPRAIPGVAFTLALLIPSVDALGATGNASPTGLNAVAKLGVERVLSFVLDAPTTVGDVQLDEKGGLLTLKDLHIANPKGFEGTDALSVAMAQVEADPKLLFSQEPAVRLIHVKGATVNAETNALHGSNLKKLMENARRFAGNRLLQNMPRKTWRIEKGVMEACRVNLTTALLQKRTKEYTLDTIEMSFLGPDGRGMTADEAVARFLATLLEKMDLVEKGSPAEALMGILRH